MCVCGLRAYAGVGGWCGGGGVMELVVTFALHLTCPSLCFTHICTVVPLKKLFCIRTVFAMQGGSNAISTALSPHKIRC